MSRPLDGLSYTVNVPPGLVGDAVPLLLSIHGFGGSPTQQEQGTGWTPFAARQGFIVGSTTTYGCAAGTQVVARVVENVSHNWPSGAQGEDQRERMWAFFQANPKP